MISISSLQSAWRETWVRIALGLIIIGLAVFAFRSSPIVDEDTSPTPDTPLVSLITANEYGTGAELSLIGRVRPLQEATITAERGGRVISVPVSLGTSVVAGEIIAVLENASERAAVVQAEGRYEAALATAAQSNVSEDEAIANLNAARNNAVSVVRTSYNTANGIVKNSIDAFFSNPDGFVPGLMINGRGLTDEISELRLALQTELPNWESMVNSTTVTSDLEQSLEESSSRVRQVTTLVDHFLTVFESQNGGSRYTDVELRNFGKTFTGLRAELIALQEQINAAETRLETAADTLRRANLSGTEGAVSVSNAQVKQALGSLQAAQAALAETVLRTPVAGTVNNLSVRVGDFITSFTPVAVVANNNAFEVITYVSQADRSRINIGDTVTVADSLPGQVSNIAPAVDRETGKIEVRIVATDLGLLAGDTVRVKTDDAVSQASLAVVRIPLTAVRFTDNQPFVFTVSETNTLQKKFITLGDVLGDAVAVSNGLTMDQSFVRDARGLISSTTVIVRDS